MASGHGPVLCDTVLEHSFFLLPFSASFSFFFFWCSYSRSLAVTGVDSTGEGEGLKALDCGEVPYGIDFL